MNNSDFDKIKDASIRGTAHAGVAYGGQKIQWQECQHPKCECHECTQARYQMSRGGLGSTSNG